MTAAATSFRTPLAGTSGDVRVRSAIDAHYDSLWRFVRRMGVEESQVEDALQIVLLVYAERGHDVKPAAVRSFLFGTALRVSSDFRRRSAKAARAACWETEIDGAAGSEPDAEHCVSQRELRQWLDHVLESLAVELRAVFVLAELEEMTMAEISKALGIPSGTVASRLRRAREIFAGKAQELRKQLEEGRALKAGL